MSLDSPEPKKTAKTLRVWMGVDVMAHPRDLARRKTSPALSSSGMHRASHRTSFSVVDLVMISVP